MTAPGDPERGSRRVGGADPEILWHSPDALILAGRFDGGPVGAARAEYRARSDRLLAAARARLGLPDRPLPRNGHGAPVWPPGQRGSFSHWRGRSVCLLRRGEDLDPGVDLEGYADPETRAAIRQEALRPREIAAVERAGLGPGVAETLAFSAKESFFKAASPRRGRELDFDAVEARELGAEEVVLRVTRALGPRLREGVRLRVSCRLFPDHALTWLFLPVEE